MPDTEPPATAAQPSWPYRAATYRVVIGVVATVTLVVGLDAWWIGTRPPRAEAGEVVRLGAAAAEGLPERDLPEAERVPVITPAGAVEVTSGVPVDELASGLRAADAVDYPDPDPDAQGYLAPRDEVFVPIRWRQGSDVLVAAPPVEDTTSERADELPPPTLAVVVDDEVVYGPVDLEAADEEDAIAVAAPETSDVEVRIAFDDATQTVDARTGALDAGVAQAYYDLDDQGGFAAGTCGWDEAPGSDLRLRPPYCAVEQAAVAPWRPGAGWVDEAGQTWAGLSYGWIVPSADDPDRPSSRFFTCADGRLESPRLDGAAATDLVASADRDGCAGRVQYAGWLLDDVPDGLLVTFEGEATFEHVVDDDRQPRVDVGLALRLSASAGA